MSTERLLVPNGISKSDNGSRTKMAATASSHGGCRIFDELPKATIVAVSRPETADISPMLLSYTLELQYKQFRWRLEKKASQVLYLHFALKKRLIIEELHEKQEQVKEWLHSLGIVDLQVSVVQDEEEPDDGAVPLHYSEESVKNRNIPSRAALSIIRPSLGRQQRVSDRGRVAMQGYVNLFLGNLDVTNSREVCKFLEVSRLSFAREYGPKLKEGYLMAKHIRKVPGHDGSGRCCGLCHWLSCCGSNWRKVWAVLKPGFLALLEDPFSAKLLDIMVFEVLPFQNNEECSSDQQMRFAEQNKGRNPLRYAFRVTSGNRSIKLRTTSTGKIKEWINAINETGWCSSHRFGSFAPPRGLKQDGSQAQWFVDGHVAFEAIASAIENAKSEIFMTGWWLCPDLYLRRPFQDHAFSRLDALLETKAKEGVKIYILMYKEVQIALKINSMYSKKRLQNIHKNVRVLRYPDHLSTRIYLWSHHEKIVIVDYQICFIGGLDLCFGRYDTVEHKVGDFPPSIWPGKDYYNPRESEPNSWEDTMRDELDRKKYPRMPWHDVHCALYGPPCRDIARHFVQRWNHSKRNKAPNEQTIPLLMPHHHMVLPHYMGTREINITTKQQDRDAEEHVLSKQDSFSSTSPTLDIPLLLPQETDAEFTTSAGDLKLSNCSRQDKANSTDHESEKMSGESDQDETNDQWLGQIGPRTDCRCQIIRSVSQWSAGTSQPEESIHRAYCSLIENAEHFIYVENQFFISGLAKDETIQNRVLEALYRRILQAHKYSKRFRVIIVIPLLPGFQGGIDDFGAATVRALMHWQYRTISRERTSILDNLYTTLGPKTKDYISFYGLRSYGRLFEGGPVATSQIYVHSKLMIVDDRIALIGSSNINDRSLLGSRDSEIGVVIEDKDYIDSSMNGESWKAGKFSHSLRCSLWSEHLGLELEEIKKVSDPVSDYMYKELWMATAKANTKIYHDVFSCIPNDLINSRGALRHNMSLWKDKLGHTTIDLGIAPMTLKSSDNKESKVTDPLEKLKETRGHLVCFPLEFMRQEDLRPMFNETEFYTSPQVFH